MAKITTPTFYKEVKLNLFPYKFPSFPTVTLLDTPIRQLHYHNVFEIGYCFSGMGECQYDNTHEKFKDGDASLFYPFQSHFSKSNHHTPSQWRFSYFDVSKVFSSTSFNKEGWEMLVLNKEGLSGIIKQEKHPHICECIKKIILTSTSNDENKIIKCQLLIGELLVYITEISTNHTKSTHKKDDRTLRLMPALQYINRNFKEQITITQLANMCFMSVTSFRENFKQQTGKSPFDYIFDIRMNYACYYLEYTTLTIREICKTCGFSDTANFYRHFIKQFGISPSEYKTQQKKHL